MMPLPDRAKVPTCMTCGCTVHEAASRGAYFKRIGPKGQPPIGWQCVPSCRDDTGTQADALRRAITKEFEQ